MRRATVLTVAEWISMDKSSIDALINKPDYVLPVERKSDSFGWLNGKLVAVDYGN